MMLNEWHSVTSHELLNETFRKQHPRILEKLHSGIGAILDDKSWTSQYTAQDRTETNLVSTCNSSLILL